MSIKPKLKIFLADDDAVDASLFSGALDELPSPSDFTWAEDGVMLLNFLNEFFLPDIIFLDVNLPCIDGIECLRQIRSNDEFDSIPIVMYSSYYDESNINTCYQTGANLYIVNPFTYPSILNMLTEVISIDWKNRMLRTHKNEFVRYYGEDQKNLFFYKTN